MKRKKKGFTIVELVIVIAVIAILASVLIPTFSGIIVKVKNSSDIQLCRNMNTTLATELSIPSSASEVQTLFTNRGYGEDFSSTYEGNTYYWYKDKNIICLVDSSNTIVFPEDDDGEIQAAYDSSKVTCFFALNGDYTSQADSGDDNNQTNSSNSGDSQQTQDSNNNSSDNDNNEPLPTDDYWFLFNGNGLTNKKVKIGGTITLDYKAYDFSLCNKDQTTTNNIITDSTNITCSNHDNHDKDYFSFSNQNNPGIFTIQYAKNRNENGDKTTLTISYNSNNYTLIIEYYYKQTWNDNLLPIQYRIDSNSYQLINVTSNNQINLTFNNDATLKFHPNNTGNDYSYSYSILNTEINISGVPQNYPEFKLDNNNLSVGQSIYFNIECTYNNTLYTCRIKVTRT